MPVVGLGGIFFRARDPEALKAWYRDTLGVGGGCVADGVGDEPNEWVWTCRGGPMVFQPFKADSDYFAPSDKSFMINLRVDDLDGMIADLEAKGIEILGRQEEDYGRFAWIMDPDGVKVELYEQAASS